MEYPVSKEKAQNEGFEKGLYSALSEASSERSWEWQHRASSPEPV